MLKNRQLFIATFSLTVILFFAGCSASDSSSNPETSSASASVSSASVSGSSSAAATPTSSASVSASAEAWRDTCTAVINAYRATEGAAALSRNGSEESCVDTQSAADLASNSAHGHFGNCNEYAQNTAPNIVAAYYDGPADMARQYLKMMWEDEKAKAEAGDTVYMDIGHYVNMRNKNYTSVACGIAYNADSSKAWINIDFYY